MGNAILLFIFLSISVSAIIIGKDDGKIHELPQEADSTIPHIGSIEVLNGCGVEGAANRMADFLRSRQFDVKNIDNAPSWNYPYTMVISRTQDLAVAEKIAESLNTDKLVIIRTNENIYDVTVITGPDFGERI
ncbi:hypothetical protein CHISP_2252 [Chitinispirillum alkaliphilum]|nr:hypothetical protein CHISP_2252 [Chitinispirillum alkaliphilum]